MLHVARFLCFVFFFVLLHNPFLFADSRGIFVETAMFDGTGWGDYYALIVGINDYREWTPLQTAAEDAAAWSRWPTAAKMATAFLPITS